ncbi:MAG: hypothetical protein KVP17_005051 [Porospora cf. gigantea B]|uniref:uncharacterized protein n=1 Tax=Porospora cf. gigantea B TaxID=2853592 RepID=UPI003571E387|nr:MAG: hypothetical protein KVP17_005051 [Porospora cf. gigantea B]
MGPLTCSVGAVAVTATVSVLLSKHRSAVLKWQPELLSLGAGTLLGDALLHILPHQHDNGYAFHLVVLGIVLSQLLEDAARWMPRWSVKPVALNNLVSDFIHNGYDGLVLAAAWKQGVGPATAVAVLVHELAQEIGDFVLLTSAGLSNRKVVAYNILVSLSCPLGVVMGSRSGLDQEGCSGLLAVAAGNFLHMALTEMLPAESKNCKTPYLIAGLVVMLSLAAHETHNH